MTDAVYCPPDVDCPCYAALTAENERLRAEIDMIRRTAAAWLDAHKAQSDRALKYVSELNRVIAERDEVVAEIERLRAGLRNAYEVYAGSDGFIPETAAEGYLQQIIKQMVDCISAALEKKP